ncbi:MAG: DNA gyrase inhibitor YacG [Polyangiales bacterium]
MKAVRCPICKKQLPERTKSFPFCSARCRLVDAGNWFDGGYRVESEEAEPSWPDTSWGEN